MKDLDQIDVDISIYPVECDSFGFIALAITGGTPPYEVLLDGMPIPPGLTIEDLEPGTYILTVSDANGCNVGAVALFVGDNCPEPPCEELIIDGKFSKNATCGDNDGWAMIIMDNTAGIDYTYDWSPNTTNFVDSFAYNLSAGVYFVTVADASNPDSCFIVEAFAIGDVGGPDPVCEVEPDTCGLNTGTITFTGDPSYNYQWDPPVSTGPEATNLPAGTYFVTITDTTDCVSIMVKEIEEIPSIAVDYTINNSPDCDLDNGSVTINATGGSGNYSYEWNPDVGTPNMSGETRTDLPAGIYSVTVTDDDTGCTNTLVVPLSPDGGIDITINSVSEILCPGDDDGTVTFTVNSTNPTTVQIVDVFGNEYQNGSLGPGFYCIVASDSLGCFAFECFEIEAPTQINVVVEIEDENCDSLGSIILVDVNGGAGGYMYEWDPPITTDSLATDLEPGDYSITVSDANGCSISGTIPIMADTNKITIDLMPDTLICDTSILIDFTITPESATVVWTDEDGNPFDPSLPVTPTDTSTYYVEVSSGDCFAMDSVTIIEGAVNILVEYDSITCLGSDSIIVITNLDSGDTLMYTWGPDSLIVIDGNENTGSPTINIDSAGDYSIYYDVTNQYGCLQTDTLEIIVVDSLVVDTIVSTMQCDSLTVDFSVNESPFVTYVWNFGDPGNPGGAIGPNPSHEYSDTGCYHCYT